MRIAMFVAVPVLLAGSIAAGCSSSSSPAPGNIYCSATLAGTQLCYGYKNLNADQQNSVTTDCKQTLMGTIVSSCPTASLVGCCSYTMGGIAIESCSYGGGEGGTTDPTTDMMVCSSESGTWSTSQ